MHNLKEKLKNKDLITNSLLIFGLIANSILVYLSGGINSIFINTYFIIIIIVAIMYGFKKGLIVALFAGLAIFPLIFLGLNNNPNISFSNWLLYQLLFIIISLISGYYFSMKSRESNVLIDRYSRNLMTNIPNINSIFKPNLPLKDKECIFYRISIMNKNYIQEVLGVQVYHEILLNTYQKLIDFLPEESFVVQANEEELFLLLDELKGLDMDSQIKELLNNVIEVSKVSVYVDYLITYENKKTISDCRRMIENQSMNGFNETNKKYKKSVFSANGEEIISTNDLIERFPFALKENELELVYQPVINSKTLKIKGFEALLRWNSKKYGLIMPDDFIEIIEMTSYIQDLTDWVIRTAMKKQRDFYKKNFNFNLSVNISAKNLQDKFFYKRVKAILNEEGINASSIIFEITETNFLSNTDVVMMNLENLKELGFRIAIDDFGKGFSSFSYLSQFKVDIIKIDKYFIQNIVKQNNNYKIVNELINLAHNLNLSIVAEGVETESIFNLVKDLGCDYVQGYYFARPIEEAKTLAYIQNYALLFA